MTTIAICLATLALNPVDTSARDEVDLIEINHYRDEKGRHVVDQIIFYDWSSIDGRLHVRDWRMLKRPAQIPHRDWQRGDFVAVWQDRQNGESLRTVRAPAMRETWTRYDPEIIDKEMVPESLRRKLTPPRGSRR